jgi:hypothetical protein
VGENLERELRRRRCKNPLICSASRQTRASHWVCNGRGACDVRMDEQNTVNLPNLEPSTTIDVEQFRKLKNKNKNC